MLHFLSGDTFSERWILYNDYLGNISRYLMLDIISKNSFNLETVKRDDSFLYSFKTTKFLGLLILLTTLVLLRSNFKNVTFNIVISYWSAMPNWERTCETTLYYIWNNLRSFSCSSFPSSLRSMECES